MGWSFEDGALEQQAQQEAQEPPETGEGTVLSMFPLKTGNGKLFRFHMFWRDVLCLVIFVLNLEHPQALKFGGSPLA